MLHLLTRAEEGAEELGDIVDDGVETVDEDEGDVGVRLADPLTHDEDDDEGEDTERNLQEGEVHEVLWESGLILAHLPYHESGEPEVGEDDEHPDERRDEAHDTELLRSEDTRDEDGDEEDASLIHTLGEYEPEGVFDDRLFGGCILEEEVFDFAEHGEWVIILLDW